MKKTTKTRIILNAAQGAWRAKTGMYVLIHEDFEYQATLQCVKRVGLARF